MTCMQVIDKINLEDEVGSVTRNARQASPEYMKIRAQVK